MENTVKTILISQVPIPYKKTGSWTTMYGYYIEHFKHKIDYIVCDENHTDNKSVQYQHLRGVSVLDKIQDKFIKGKRYNNYFEALDKIIEPNTKYIIQIVDNKGVVNPLHQFLSKKHNRSNFCVQYFYHGFILNFKNNKGAQFFKSIDELFLLTKQAQLELNKVYGETGLKIRYLHNGVNSEVFKAIAYSEKIELRQHNHINTDELVFLWCSQDRPKKGLNIALAAFDKVHTKYSKTKLLVVGVNKVIEQSGVEVIGKVPNKDLPKYYQMADVFLFTTLCEEGFGLVLAEALKCGCYCIASNFGGVPEVLNFGKYGVLIDEPFKVDKWVIEMENAVSEFEAKGENPYLKDLPKNSYNLEDWCKQMNVFIDEASIKLHNS
mgnify:FL=1